MSAEANNNKRPSRKDYRRVVRKDTENTEKGKSAPNEIRVTASRGQRFYISYALDLFNGANDKPKSDTVILSGMGEAIYNVVNIAEVVKRRVKGLHQTCDIGSQTMSDEYEPLKDKEGLEKIVVQRKVSTITIVLSTKQLDTAHIGYQAPLPESEVKEGPPERKPREEGEERPRRGGRDRRPRGDDEKPARGDDSRRGGRRGGDNNDRPRGGRGASRGGRDDRPREDRPRRDDRPREDRPPRRDDREDRTRGGSRGGRDDRPREDRPPRRDDREDRPRGGRGGPRRDDRDFRDAPARGGNRGPRDDRPPRRDDREDRPRGDRGAPRGGNGGGRGGERAARGAPRGGYGGERRDGGRGGQAPRR